MEIFIGGALLWALILNLVISFTFPVLVLLISYIFRGNYNIDAYCNLKEKFISFYGTEGQFWSYLAFIIVLLIVGGCISDDNNITGVELCLATYYIFGIPSLLFILPLLRWLVDVARTLKIKRSTGDSEKLAEMQKQLNELNDKLNK